MKWCFVWFYHLSYASKKTLKRVSAVRSRSRASKRQFKKWIATQKLANASFLLAMTNPPLISPQEIDFDKTSSAKSVLHESISNLVVSKLK